MRLSDGAVLETWPISRYGSQFAYDRVTGDLYFLPQTTAIGMGSPSYVDRLLRVNGETGATKSIPLPRTFEIRRVANRLMAHNGKIYFINFYDPKTQVGTELLKIDTTVTPTAIQTLATNPSQTSIGGAPHMDLIFGGPGDSSLYAPDYKARIVLD